MLELFYENSLRILQKSSTVDVWQGSKYVS